MFYTSHYFTCIEHKDWKNNYVDKTKGDLTCSSGSVAHTLMVHKIGAQKIRLTNSSFVKFEQNVIVQITA